MVSVGQKFGHDLTESSQDSIGLNSKDLSHTATRK